MKVTMKPIVIGALGTIPKGMVKGLDDFGMRTSVNHPDNIIIKIVKNTEKGPESWGSLLSPNPLRKTLKGIK